MKTYMQKIKKARYNIVLRDEERKILEKIAKLENQTMSDVIGFALVKLNELYQ